MVRPSVVEYAVDRFARLGSTPINFFCLAKIYDSISAEQQAGAGKWRVQT